MENSSFNRESERRLATVMFADISGFTAMSEKMDPEDVTSIMNDCFAMMEEIIEKHEGTIDKFIGDCVMVLFGLPNAIESASQKALSSAIEIRKGLYRFNIEKNLKIPLDIHMGVNSGIVVAGMVGGENKQEYTVMGDTVNLAARLEDTSRKGQILVGHVTYGSTKDKFRYRYLKPLTLKGKENTVPAYELLSKNGRKTMPITDNNKIIHSELVGRTVEMDILESHIMKVVAGHGSIVNLVGEAGIGKTRLIQEIKNLVIMTRITLLEGKAILMGRNLSFYPLVQLLRNWAGINEDDSEYLALNKLETAIKNLYTGDIEDVLPFTATFMGIKLPQRYAKGVKGIKGVALEKLIIKNIRELLLRGSERRPIVVILEDLHWADTSSIELIKVLYSLVETNRVLFINVFRPGHQKIDGGISSYVKEKYPSHHGEINLMPMNEPQGEMLINNLLNIKDLPNGVRIQILLRTGGNPYFIEEVVRSMVEVGAVKFKNSRFEITGKINTFVVPQTISDVLMYRMDQLDENTRYLVRVASVIGRSFFYRIISKVANSVTHLDQRLGYLKKMGFITETIKNKETEYSFKHALAQEAAYESILLKKRRALHINIAETIEKLFSEKLHEVYGVLAFHYSSADEMDRAEGYMIKAGKEALKTAASSEALHYYREALKIYLSRYGSIADPNKIVMIEKNIALALFNKGQLKEAVYYIDRVLLHYGIKSQNSYILSPFKFILFRINFIVSLLLPSLKWKKIPTKQDSEIINMAHTRLQALSTIDPTKFYHEAFSFIYILSKFDLKRIENGVGFFSNTSLACSWVPKWNYSFTVSRLISKFVKDKVNSNDIRMVLYYELSELFPDLFTGKWRKEYNYELVEQSMKIGEIYLASIYISFHCRINIEKGDYDRALELVNKLHETGKLYGHDFPKALKYVVHSKLLMKHSEFNQALNELDEGIDFISKTDFKQLLFVLFSLKARTLDFIGDSKEAKKTLELADEIKPEEKIPPLYLSKFLLSRFIHELYGLKRVIKNRHRQKIRQQLSRALKFGKKAVKISEKVASDRTEATRLIGTCYWLVGKQKKALKWWNLSIAEGKRIGADLELSRSLMEVGTRLLEPSSKHSELSGVNAKEYVEMAKNLSDQIGLKLDSGIYEKNFESFESADLFHSPSLQEVMVDEVS